MGFIKKDRIFARLKESSLAQRGGLYLYYEIVDPNSFVDLRVLWDEDVLIGIRVGRCHKKAVERNRLRRWVKEIFREYFRDFDTRGNRYLFLVSVGIKDRPLRFGDVKQILEGLISDIIKDVVPEGDKRI